MTGKTANWKVKNTMLNVSSNFKTLDFFMAGFHVDYCLADIKKYRNMVTENLSRRARPFYCSAENIGISKNFDTENNYFSQNCTVKIIFIIFKNLFKMSFMKITIIKK